MTKGKRRLPPIGKCFDHVGGKLAPLLFGRLIEMEWIRPQDGKKTVFEATEKGKRKFKQVFGIDISKLDEEF